MDASTLMPSTIRHLRVLQHGELVHETGLLHLDLRGQARRQRRCRQHADDGDSPERGAPADCLTERGAKRHAKHIGKREAGKHQGDCLRAAVRRHEACRHDRADAEERAVAKRRDDACDHQHAIVRRDCTEQIADDKHTDQAHQRLLARHVRDRDGDDRRADRDAQRVSRYQHAGRGNRDGQIARHIGQQTHDDEFTGTDSKRGYGKGKQRQRHDGEIGTKSARCARGRRAFRNESAGAGRSK